MPPHMIRLSVFQGYTTTNYQIYLLARGFHSTSDLNNTEITYLVRDHVFFNFKMDGNTIQNKGSAGGGVSNNVIPVEVFVSGLFLNQQ